MAQQTAASYAPSLPSHILQLQKTIGNRATTQWLKSGALQEKPAERPKGPPTSDSAVIQRWEIDEMQQSLLEVADDELRDEVNRAAFARAIEVAHSKSSLSEQASSLAASIKSGQFFQNGNTRVSTAAVFLIYHSAGGKKLAHSPLQVLAAIGEKELHGGFNLTQWLQEAEEDSDSAQAVPDKEQLDSIHDQIAVIHEAQSRLSSVLSRWLQYREQHMTEAEAREDYANDPQLNSRGTFEYLYEGEEFPTEDQRRQNFLDDLDYDDETIWKNRDKIENAQQWIEPEGKGHFSDTVESGEDIRALDADDLLERLDEIIAAHE